MMLRQVVTRVQVVTIAQLLWNFWVNIIMFFYKIFKFCTYAWLPFYTNISAIVEIVMSFIHSLLKLIIFCGCVLLLCPQQNRRVLLET